MLHLLSVKKSRRTATLRWNSYHRGSKNGSRGRSYPALRKSHLDPREVCGRHGVQCNICLGDGFFTLPAALRQQKLTIWVVRRATLLDIRCAPAMRGGTRVQCGSAVATRSTAKSWKKKLSRPFYGSRKGRNTKHAVKLQNTPIERCVGHVCSRPVA